MCILFVYLANANRPIVTRRSGKYLKFALISNRDENYQRPSVPARFWESDSNILAGQDMESGGTWLGINKKTGKIAAITNIMGGTVNDAKNPKVSRGAVLTDFLNSGANLSGRTYCTNLYHDPDILTKYNKFNLITIDLNPVRASNTSNNGVSFPDSTLTGTHLPSITFFTNAANNSSPETIHSTSQDQYFGVSNSEWQRPFNKVMSGRQTFQKIVEKYIQVEWDNNTKSLLKDELLGVLKNTQEHLPDVEMERLAKEQVKPFLHLLSSTYVTLPQAQYGTRTQTLIFVDSENSIDFYEWSMEEPINIEHPNWLHSKFHFRLCT